jgi:outer membrane protein assembly factor BamD (BamD/ComL family)
MKWAVEAYNAYLKSYPQGPNRDRALKRRVIANLAQYRGPQRDATSLLDARRQINQLQRELPREAERLELDERMVSLIDEELAAQTLEGAKWRLKRGEPAAARFVMERLIRRRPGSEAAREAQRIMLERGWIEPTPVEAIAPETEESAS